MKHLINLTTPRTAFLKTAIVLIAVLTVAGFAHAAVPVIQVGSDDGNCGDVLKVPVVVNNADNVSSFGFDVEYDASTFNYLSTQTGEATSSWVLVQANEVEPGIVRVGGFRGVGAPVVGSGELVVLTFLVDICPSVSDVTVSNQVDDVANSLVSAGTLEGLAFSGASGTCGGMKNVPITIWDAQDMDAFGMTILFNSAALAYKGTAKGAHTDTWALVEANQPEPGRLVLGGIRGAGAFLNGKVEVAVVTFECLECPSYNNLEFTDQTDGAEGKTVTSGSASCSPFAGIHGSDQDQDQRIGMQDLLRVVQLYNMQGYHCDDASEDGFAGGAGDTACMRHSADFGGAEFKIDLTEVLRQVQIFNYDGGTYHPCFGSEDGFCPGRS
jgi:hypothetical protein